MRVLITGASGFIGSAIAKRLHDTGNDLCILTHNALAKPRLASLSKECRILTCDYAQPELLGDIVAETAPHAVIHCAWEGVSNQANNALSQCNNLRYSVALMQAAIQAKVSTFIGTGSQAEYGLTHGVTSESQVLQPFNLYGACKASVFLALQAQAIQNPSMRFVWGRIFSAYGPSDNTCWLLPKIITSLMRGEDLSMTEGRQLWDYCYVEDIAQAFNALLESENAKGVFNIGSGTATAVHDLACAVENEVRKYSIPGKLLFGAIPYGANQIMHLQADIRRIHQVTGWFPQTSFAEGISRTVAWYAANGESKNA